MLRLIANAFVNGLIGLIGVLTTHIVGGQDLTSTIFIGASLTGLSVALKDIHSILQEPPTIR